MSLHGNGPTLRIADQGPMHIRNVQLQVDYFDDDSPVTPPSNVTLHNSIHSIRNNNNNNFCMYTRRRHPAQSTMFDYLSDAFRARYGTADDDDVNTLWGQHYSTKIQNTTRVWYTNPRGRGENPNNHKSHSTLMFLSRKSQAGVVCLAETNLRWPSLQYGSRLNNRLKAFCQDYNSVSSSNKHENLGKCQRGGTCAFAVNQLTHRTRKCGVDATGMGRWSWLQFEGENGHITRILTAYRPCRAPTNSGLTTNWDQQTRYLRNIKSTHNPIQQFDIDIIAIIRKWIEANYLIIICIDINDHATDSPFAHSIRDLGLINIHATHMILVPDLSQQCMHHLC